MNFIIKPGVYPFDIFVSIGESDDVLFKELRKYNLDESCFDLCRYAENGTGRCVRFIGGQTVLRIKSKPKTPTEFGVLHHEIFHAAAFILDAIGMKLSLETSDEAYAYFVQFITERIYEKIKI